MYYGPLVSFFLALRECFYLAENITSDFFQIKFKKFGKFPRLPSLWISYINKYWATSQSNS